MSGWTREPPTVDEWAECWNCAGDGCSYHDCGEDACCCADPEPNIMCHVCDGNGGWPTPIPPPVEGEGRG